MLKKLGIAFSMVPLFLFAVTPATASTGLTQAGSLVKVGTELQGRADKNINGLLISTSIGKIQCDNWYVYGTLTTNSAVGGVAISGLSKGTASGCTFTAKEPTAISLTNLRLSAATSTPSEAGTAKMGLSVEADIPGLTCKYSATALPATYVAGTNSLDIKKGALTAAPAACGTATLEAAHFMFTVHASGTSVTFD